jgi:hypothetical protein
VDQALRDLLVCLYLIHIQDYYYYHLLSFINCIFCKVLLFNTIVTVSFFQLLLLNGHVKHSGYFGSFLAAYCVTLIQGLLLSGPIVGLKGRAYKWKQSVVVYVVPARL